MNKRIRLISTNGNIEDMGTSFEYTVGETITVNDSHNIYKCVEIINIDSDTICYCFKQGIRTYGFDW